LKTILEKSLEKNRSDRYPTAHSFAEDVGRFRRLEPIHARRVGALGRLSRWARRRPAMAALSALLIVAVVSTGVLLQAQRRAAAFFSQ
jgi:hypothetical protein